MQKDENPIVKFGVIRADNIEQAVNNFCHLLQKDLQKELVLVMNTAVGDHRIHRIKFIEEMAEHIHARYNDLFQEE